MSKARIINAAGAINDMCDGAIEQDGVGFNGSDSPFFKRYLKMDAFRTDLIVLEMYARLRKYSGQLEACGIPYSDLAPEYEEPEAGLRIDPTWHTVIMPFGKLKGKSFAEIYMEDPNYISWIANSFEDGSLKEAAKAIIAGNPIGLVSQFEKKEIDVNKPQPPKGEYISFALVNEDIEIKASYGYKDKIKELSIRNWNPDKRMWITKLNIAEEITTKFPEATIDPAIIEHLENRKKLKSISNAMNSKATFELGNFGHGKKLMPFQLAGLEFIERSNGRCMLSDEMGTGKTCQTLSYLQLHKDLRPAIIVCPASLKFNWKNEIKSWLDDENSKVEIINGGKSEALTGNIIVINYDILGKWVHEIKKINPQVLIFDESHMLKNQKAMRTKVASDLAKSIPKVIELTGTPIMNRPVELFSQLNILNPQLYPESVFFSYAKKYCNAEQGKFGWNFNGASNIDKLADELKGIMIRRTKAQVLPELPEKRRCSVLLPMTNKAKYEKQENAFKRWVLENKGQNAAGMDALPKIEYMKQMCVEGKMSAAIDWIENSFVANNEKLVLFATHKATINSLMEKFGDIAVKFDGSSSQKDREEAVTRFQNDPKVLLFIGNTKAAGVGITLTSASNVAFIEFDWTCGIHDQAEDRCNRIGQKNAVTCYYLVATDSIDEVILSMLEHKRTVIDGVMDDDKEIDFKLFEKILERLD